MVKKPSESVSVLAEEVRSGRTVVLFPPGVFAFVGMLMIVLFAFATVWVGVIGIWREGLTAPKTAVLQLSGLPLIVPGMVLPTFMILRGRKKYLTLLRLFCGLILMGSFLAGARAFVVGDLFELHLVSGGFGLAALGLSASRPVGRLCEFFYLLKRDL